MRNKSLKQKLRLFLYLLLASPILALAGYFSPARFSEGFKSNGWDGAIVGLSIPLGYLFYVLVVDVLRFKFLEITDEDLKTLDDRRLQWSHIIITAKIMVMLVLFYVVITYFLRLLSRFF
jgi:mannose/fructose/N-acetylgalactosamine-specific phosphotransferase system component IIC